jgi:hypothetical protein
MRHVPSLCHRRPQRGGAQRGSVAARAKAASSHLALDPVQLGFVVSFNKPGGNATMIFKMLALAAAAIPIFLFVRSMLLRRPTRINEGYKEFKKQSDLAVSIFMFLIGCVVIFAVGKLVWAWL